jgi:ATP-dependent RNA helicase RhlE
MTVTFDSFGLSPDLMVGVADLRFSSATPIQAAAIPVAMAGRDIIGCASTGTGKTAAFLLPTLNRLSTGPRNVIRALVLSPTRELALQIDEQAMALAYHMGLSVASVVGGLDMSPQEDAFKAGAEIVVATPGRLLDHMRYPYVDLSHVEVLILDEADRMLDMGFIPDVRRIVRAIPTERQTLLFSATMAPAVRKLTEELLKDPVEISVNPQKPAAGIAHRVFAVSHARKGALLTTLMGKVKMQSVVVFVRRKSEADKLARQIERAGFPATSIHSGRDQGQRIAALESFRKGEVGVLVATDVAARGLDVDGITHVVNYDVPHSADDYIHRGGRTARAGARGEVFTFVAPDEEEQMERIERAVQTELPRVKLPGFDRGLDGPQGRSSDRRPPPRGDRGDRGSFRGR